MAKSVAEQLIAAIFAELPAGTATAIGRTATAAHHAPPSVIAIPLGASEISQPNRPGDARYTDVGRQLYVRHFRIEWWCHGAPDDESSNGLFGDAESIYLALIHAARKHAHYSLEIGDERWIDQEEGGDGLTRHGTTIVVTTTIAIPIYEARSKTVTLQSPTQIVTTAVLNDEEV